MRRVCGAHGEKLVAMLALYAFGTDEQVKRKLKTKYGPRHEVRIDALTELRNMGFGVPKQGIEIDGPEGATVPVMFYLPTNGRDQHS